MLDEVFGVVDFLFLVSSRDANLIPLLVILCISAPHQLIKVIPACEFILSI